MGCQTQLKHHMLVLKVLIMHLNPLAGPRGPAQNWQKKIINYFFFGGAMFAYNTQQHAYIC